MSVKCCILLITDFNYKLNLKQNTNPKTFSLKTWIEFEKHKKNSQKQRQQVDCFNHYQSSIYQFMSKTVLFIFELVYILNQSSHQLLSS